MHTEIDQFEIPECCPVCGGDSEIIGDFLHCKSKKCPSKLSGSIKAWIKNFGLLQWGDVMVESLTSKNKVKCVADIYKLSVDELSEHCSGMKMAKKCHAILHSNKFVSLDLVLASLNIANLGQSTASSIVHAGYNTVEKVLAIDFNELKNIKDIGEKTARQIQEGLIIKRDELVALDKVLDIHLPRSGSLHGKTVCITGGISIPRKAAEKLIIGAGGSPKSSVSKDTSFLVTNNPDTSSSKMVKAKKYGIPVIDEVELMKIIGSMNVNY